MKRMSIVVGVAALLVGSTMVEAGPVPPKRPTVERVAAGATDVYTVTFRGGERATVTVRGDGDTDLDLYVYDENGNLIVKDDDHTDNCVVSFTPKWTGPFKIRVVNRGNVYNQYTIHWY
jgi:hypothetical protein